MAGPGATKSSISQLEWCSNASSKPLLLCHKRTFGHSAWLVAMVRHSVHAVLALLGAVSAGLEVVVAHLHTVCFIIWWM